MLFVVWWVLLRKCVGELGLTQSVVVYGVELVTGVPVGCYVRDCPLVGVLRTSRRLLGSNSSNVWSSFLGLTVLVRSSSLSKISLSLLRWFVLSLSKCWKRGIVSPCVTRVSSILSSLSQFLEMDSLSFWMEFERSLSDVMELVALDMLATDAHVFVGDLLYVLTDLSASFNSGSGFESNVISVLKRTSGLYEVGTSLRSCLQCSL